MLNSFFVLKLHTIPKGKAIGFKPLMEEWSHYSLDDGNILGVRIIVSKVMKTDQLDATGLPIYVFQSTNVVQVLTQDEYRDIVRLQK
ncbi:MAG: hypothetical protein HXX80_00520 [Nitrososphaerales archaeon]|nr:hypothetical protein [Nitrososphaerales archaeon]